MFQNAFRSKLLKHGWLRATEEGQNQSQSWRRHKNNAIRAISDLVLLHDKLPKEKRDELYNLQNLEKLFESLLPYHVSNDIVKLDIACYLVERAINVFQNHYAYYNRNTMAISDVVNEYLRKASQICSDITYKEKMKYAELRIPKEGLEYLATWKQISSREKDNLQSFFVEVMDLLTSEFTIRHPRLGKYIEGEFEEAYTKDKFYFNLKLNNIKNKASLFVTNRKDYDKVQEFTVKTQNGEYLLYYGQKEIDIIKEKGIRE